MKVEVCLLEYNIKEMIYYSHLIWVEFSDRREDAYRGNILLISVFTDYLSEKCRDFDMPSDSQ